jgi:hypothetical protein
MDVNSEAAANWTRAMKAESRVEWLEGEIERLRAALAEIVRMYDDDDECGDLDAGDLAEIARSALSSLE